MDPQARCCSSRFAAQALDSCGVDPARAAGPTASYAGATHSTYLLNKHHGRTARGLEAFTCKLPTERTTTTYHWPNITDHAGQRAIERISVEPKRPAMSVYDHMLFTFASRAHRPTNGHALRSRPMRMWPWQRLLLRITFRQKRGYLAKEGRHWPPKMATCCRSV